MVEMRKKDFGKLEIGRNIRKQMKIKQTENEVKSAVRDWLELKRWTVCRINNGGVYRGKNKQGKDRYSFAGSKGVADLFCVRKDKKVHLWIETKKTGGKPTEDQHSFLDLVYNPPYSYGIWCDSLDEFISDYNFLNLGETIA